MNAWISRKRFQEEIKRESLFMVDDDRASKKLSLILAKAIFYLKKSSLEVEHHPSRHDHEPPEGMLFDFEIT